MHKTSNKSILAMLAIAIVTTIAAVAVVEAGFTSNANADPWSWGQSPSQNWSNCYNSGSSDCSNVH
jgi:hypothetical protein